MNLLTLARRNLRKNRRRTGITVSILSGASGVMIGWGTLSEGYYRFMKSSATAYELADLQIQTPEFRQSNSIYATLDGKPEAEAELGALPIRVSKRLLGSGLAVNASSSIGVELRGINIEAERQVTGILGHIERGETLKIEDSKGVLIGRDLAQTLGIDVGGRLPILTHAADGSLASEAFHVAGILRPISRQVDSRTVLLVEQAFRDLFVLESGVHEIAVRVNDQSRSPIAEVIKALQLAFPGGEIRSWRQIRPALARTIDLLGITVFFTLSITYIALGGLVFNVILMSVMERIYEFGVMKALGMKPSTLFSMVLLEGLLVAGYATIGMLAIGLPLGLGFDTFGLDLRQFVSRVSFAGVSYDPVFYGHLGWAQVLRPMFFLLFIVPLSTLVPAIRAARIEALEALSFGV